MATLDSFFYQILKIISEVLLFIPSKIPEKPKNKHERKICTHKSPYLFYANDKHPLLKIPIYSYKNICTNKVEKNYVNINLIRCLMIKKTFVIQKYFL